MEKQRRRERLEEDMKESGATGSKSLMARVLAQVEPRPYTVVASGSEALHLLSLSRKRVCEIVGAQDGLT
jgi:hypothetical protein